jgi:hypothetical protein
MAFELREYFDRMQESSNRNELESDREEMA